MRLLESRARLLAAALILAAIALRVLLAVDAPRPEGYVWDFYHDGVRVLYWQHRLPVAEDCWQCYHPPLFYALGWPLYALGQWIAPAPPGDDAVALRVLALMPLLAGAVTIVYAYRLLQLFRFGPVERLAGLAVLCVFPCLFISSYGIEADILLTAILTAFLYYLTRYWLAPDRASTAALVGLGALAGLAAATKYNGLVALASAGVLMGLQWRAGRRFRRVLRDAAIVCAVAVAIGGWKYVDNVQRYGSALHANGPAADGFSPFTRFSQAGAYEFPTIRLGALSELFGPEAREGELTLQPVYYSVLTSLHALAWSDMSFFSVPSRHGHRPLPYPRKWMPPWLVMSVIVLGFIPELLALVGIVVVWRQRAFRPLLVFSGLTFLAYAWWFIPQTAWALKTKYILFLVGPAVVFMLAGLGWLQSHRPVLARLAGTLLVALIVVAHVYLYVFATG